MKQIVKQVSLWLALATAAILIVVGLVAVIATARSAFAAGEPPVVNEGPTGHDLRGQG